MVVRQVTARNGGQARALRPATDFVLPSMPPTTRSPAGWRTGSSGVGSRSRLKNIRRRWCRDYQRSLHRRSSARAQSVPVEQGRAASSSMVAAVPMTLRGLDIRRRQPVGMTRMPCTQRSPTPSALAGGRAVPTSNGRRALGKDLAMRCSSPGHAGSTAFLGTSSRQRSV